MRAGIDMVRPLAALVLLLVGTLSTAEAQASAADPRWNGWLGCWEAAEPQTEAASAESNAPMLCVLPDPGGHGVEIATIAGGEVVDRQLVAAAAGQRPTAEGGCSGWESAEWSADGNRLFRRSQESCAAGVTRRENGLSTLLPTGEWLDVQGAATGERMGVRVLRYREVADRERWPAEAVAALAGRARDVETARTAAAVRLTTEDVAEASRQLDAAVVEAWLVERRQGFATELDAERILELANAGVPEPVIDLMVALSYPNRFAIQGSGETQRTPDAGTVRRPVPGGVYPRGPLGYGGYGWYPGYGRYPDRVLIVGRPRGDDGGSGGRAVKGRGYRRGGDGRASPGGADRSTSPRPGASGAGSDDSRSGGKRTAKPRSGGPG